MNDINDNLFQSDKTNATEKTVPDEKEKSLPQQTDIQILKPDPNALPPKPENIM